MASKKGYNLSAITKGGYIMRIFLCVVVTAKAVFNSAIVLAPDANPYLVSGVVSPTKVNAIFPLYPPTKSPILESSYAAF
ncbi:MAG: hypothetical protein RR316_05030, partial [Clostridia bacterium]